MQLRTYCKWITLAGVVLILIVKIFLRPYIHVHGIARLTLGVAPNFLASFFMPFGAFWLYSHPQFCNGSLLRYNFFSNIKITCLFGFFLIVVNEYFQLLPVFGRTFDVYDILFSAIGYLLSYYSFSLLQRYFSYEF
jgi:hypothetical protein